MSVAKNSRAIELYEQLQLRDTDCSLETFMAQSHELSEEYLPTWTEFTGLLQANEVYELAIAIYYNLEPDWLDPSKDLDEDPYCTQLSSTEVYHV